MKFEKAVEIILEHEGGYVFHEKDPGGETKFGISKRSYPNLNIKDLTRNQAILIYKNDFWDKLKIDDLEKEVRLMYFDCAVNQGPGRARSMYGLAKSLTPHFLLAEFAKLRMKNYKSLPTFKTFGAGWSSRLLDVTIRSYEDLRDYGNRK